MNEKKMKKAHSKEHKCTLCGYQLHTLSFKDGYICENCLHSLKTDTISEPPGSKR